MSVLQSLQERLNTIKKENKWRFIPQIQNHTDKYIQIEDKHLLNLSSNNYLGLANNSLIKEAAIEAVQKYGNSSVASRIVCGNYSLYDELEKTIATFKKKPKALVFNSGYSANISLISSLAVNATIFSDKLNHASIIDGIILSRSKFFRYPHNDMETLEKLLKNTTGNKIIITDTIFSMDGDACDLAQILKLSKQYDAFVIIDEAHATGIFGDARGYAFELGLQDDIDCHMGTFSKALGSFGAYVASSEIVIDYLINTARGFIFSTALPPSVVGANLASVSYIERKHQLGRSLLLISAEIRNYLKNLGFDTGESVSQIIPVVLKTNEAVLKASKILFEKGLFVAAIRPPTVPVNTARLRLSLRVDLDRDDIQLIKEAFRFLSNVI